MIDARVLNSDLHPPYSGSFGEPHFKSFGFGPPRAYLSGVPHFRDAEFRGEFPFASITFVDDTFPGKVTMTAFNPFIPLNDKDSSLPAAFFEIQVENTSNEPLDYTVVSCIGNINGRTIGYNEFTQCGQVKGIRMGCRGVEPADVRYGELTIATDEQDISYQEYWYRGSWFDDLEMYWSDLNTPGKFKNRTYKNEKPGHTVGSGNEVDMCMLAVHFSLKPGGHKKVRFVLTWYYPNCYNYWKQQNQEQSCCGCQTSRKAQWKNYYSRLFEDSFDCAVYALQNWDRLYKDTMCFKEALFSSTLPPVVINAISANISILKTPTCLRLEDGSFYGFEGCHCDSGCCEGSCTHVWNYAYALPFLFPKLERSMRELEYRYNLGEDGSMSFRLQLPLGSKRWDFRPCVDGQFGGVLKVYREWKVSGDTEWLRKLWPSVKKSIEYAWAETNKDRWNPERTGVLTGRQHHTLDMELFGPNSWLTGFYLAALKAGAEMADYLGEKDTAREYLDIFHRGKKWVDSNLFNGEYYYHLIDLNDKSILEQFDEGKSDTLVGGTTMDTYWNEEKGEIKYQVGEGCLVDQVLAQWHANLIGLGEIFDPALVRKAVYSVYKNNFKRMRDVFNPCRVFSLNDERGVVICSYPEGRRRPAVPVPYAQETMNGFEYQIAAHLIQEGFVKEGLEIVEAIRSRYDGYKRNPWNEFECGSNYARSMASYSLLLAFSGFMFDMVKGVIGFNPVIGGDNFRVFWSLDSGWGIFEKSGDKIELKVLYGYLDLKELCLPFMKGRDVKSVLLEDVPVTYRKDGGNIKFSDVVRIGKEQKIMII
ncbi:GH116 family glycosyl-hydrolase [Caldicoprobacter faecalis]|uniref:Uncharacterized protein, contains GBA2_N and DUF608 domains n=1 Tax=Caldicoprobacter faecalis TaxID=937334 RepID=A0A1I5WK71_9FIRM|nr:Uncharacterized protein, contains GBA2_N and DUF608 domains [Caldicoprobacter faecalis]